MSTNNGESEGEMSSLDSEGEMSSSDSEIEEQELVDPWVIHGIEREVAEAFLNDTSDEVKDDMWLPRFLVHSEKTEDVHRGIAMLEASLANTSNPLRKRGKLYLLAVGYYESGKYLQSRQLVEQCLEFEPDWWLASSLKKNLDDKISKDGVIGRNNIS